MSVSSVSQSSSRSKFLDMGALQTFRNMRFAPRNRIEGRYSGRHQSRLKGGGGEFVDYREYSAGEDLRRLDWKVLARTGRPYIRLYQDETDLACTLMVDASSSMTFAGHDRKIAHSKLTYVQYLATTISQLILEQRDRVGLGLAADGLVGFHSPSGLHSHVARLQESIETVSPTPVSNLADAVRTLFNRLPRRGVLMLMSDFLVDDVQAVFAAVRLFRHNRWEVIVLHVVHPEEERLPEGSSYRFEGMENDGLADCSPAEIRDAYAKAFEAHASTVRGCAIGAGCEYRRISTAVPYLQTISSFLIERSG